MKPTVTLENNRLMVGGEVNPLTVVALRRQGEALIREAGSELEVDLSGISAAHSVVLSLMLCWVRHAQAQQRTLAFTGASERLRSLASLSGLQHHLRGLAETSAG